MSKKNIIYELLVYIFNEMNQNIEFLYERYNKEFNLTDEEIGKQGETLEQYHIYEKYESMVDNDLEIFSKEHGYECIEDLADDIEKILEYEDTIIDTELDEFTSNDNMVSFLFDFNTRELLDIILDLSSYETFSKIIRNKLNISEIECDTYENKTNQNKSFKINNYLE